MSGGSGGVQVGGCAPSWSERQSFGQQASTGAGRPNDALQVTPGGACFQTLMHVEALGASPAVVSARGACALRSSRSIIFTARAAVEPLKMKKRDPLRRILF